MSEHKKTAYQEAGDRLAQFWIDAISNPQSHNYMKPWTDRGSLLGGQHNPVTGKTYNGVNQLSLSVATMERELSDPRWLTFKQVQDLGLRLRKGSKSERVFFSQQKEGKQEEGQGTEEKEVKPQWIMRHYNVFNGSDVEGLEPYKSKDLGTVEWRHEQCEKIMEASGVPIRHVQGNRAYYSPSQDAITLPLKEQFLSEGHYYASALHELGHATGHKDRLNRDMRGTFGSPEYAKEELRAEIASMLMSQRLGIPHELGQHVAYVKSWVQLLEEKPNEILKACSDAEKICYHLGVHAQVQERVETKEITKEQQAHLEEGKQDIKAVEAKSQKISQVQAEERSQTRKRVQEEVKVRDLAKAKEKSKEQVKQPVRNRARKKEHQMSM